MWPFVINDISPSGAIILKTLGKEIMANWINGNLLWLYKLPLTFEMLETMHATKNKKETIEQKKLKAQMKAQGGILKKQGSKSQECSNLVLKSQNEWIKSIYSNSSGFWVEIIEKTYSALVDFGANYNVISHDTFSNKRLHSMESSSWTSS